jgi:hypothetical protein
MWIGKDVTGRIQDQFEVVYGSEQMRDDDGLS